MLAHIKNDANRAYTENGALSYATTHSHCLDLFATVGALRSAGDQEIIPECFHGLDESPMAYKSIEEIIAQVGPTVDIAEQIRPAYNIKASE